jgi:hypothetical protein
MTAPRRYLVTGYDGQFNESTADVVDAYDADDAVMQAAFAHRTKKWWSMLSVGPAEGPPTDSREESLRRLRVGGRR